MKRLVTAAVLSAALASAAPAHAIAITKGEMCTTPWYKLSGWQALALAFTGRPSFC